MTQQAQVVMLITEEYGFRHWVAAMPEDAFNAAIARWKTIKGLSCLVPVPFLFPTAQLAGRTEFDAAVAHAEAHGDILVRAHIHQADDSSIEGVEYDITEQHNFEIDGHVYTREELVDLYDSYQQKITST